MYIDISPDLIYTEYMTTITKQRRGDSSRNTKRWLEVLELKARPMTYSQVGQAVGISRQRAHQIVSLATVYAVRHDDDLARAIRDRLERMGPRD